MTSPVSIRFDPALLDRLRRRAAQRETTPSGLAQRLVDEGLRVQEYPGVVFKDGPSGRRAALVGGQDVWEVVDAVSRTRIKDEPRAVAATAKQLSLSLGQVRTALAYYGAFVDEIDAQIDENERAAAEALEAWRARQRLLG